MLKLFSGVNVCLITLIVNWDGNKIDIYVTQNKKYTSRVHSDQSDPPVKIHAVDLKHERCG